MAVVFIWTLISQFIHRMLSFMWLVNPVSTNILRVFVKTNVGNSVSVDLNPKWTIRQVKEIVAPKLEMSPSELKIILAGKELHDTIAIEECDLGQQSILHAVKVVRRETLPNVLTNTSPPIKDENTQSSSSTLGEDGVSEGSKPLCETLVDLDLQELESETRRLSDTALNDQQAPTSPEERRAHFFVFCSSPCRQMRKGKLRVRCCKCKGGAFTVDRDPCSWDDVLLPGRIPGTCATEGCEGAGAEFFFRCAEHATEGERDEAVALHHIKTNHQQIPCLACTDVCDPVMVFPCPLSHVACIDCFREYCCSRLGERQFVFDPEYGYTLPCPAGCDNSIIKETHHFRLIGEDQYERYQKFGAEECVLQAGGVLCPQPGCGAGILADPDCMRIQCINGCGFVFCRNCLQGYHLGECIEVDSCYGTAAGNSRYNVDPDRAAQATWDEDSKTIIRVITKPCPKCRTPTERDGGCMHMVCTRSQCGFHWCWVCQTEWTRECMGNHWFG